LKSSRSIFARWWNFGTNQRRTTTESIAGAQSQEGGARPEEKKALRFIAMDYLESIRAGEKCLIEDARARGSITKVAVR
jgi:hypothetical protein